MVGFLLLVVKCACFRHPLPDEYSDDIDDFLSPQGEKKNGSPKITVTDIKGAIWQNFIWWQMERSFFGPKLFWPTVRKKIVLVIEENFFKFDYESRYFIPTVKNFWNEIRAFLKLRYCEKVTKLLSNVKTSLEIFSNFCGLSENLNFDFLSTSKRQPRASTDRFSHFFPKIFSI